jgi:hypothetical protein
VSAATCSAAFFKLIAVKSCGTPASSGLNAPAIAENADPAIPLAASIAPESPVIGAGTEGISDPIDGNPGKLGKLGKPGMLGKPGTFGKLGILGNPGILAIVGKPGILGKFGILGKLGRLTPFNEVAIELNPPLSTDKLAEKFPELIELATLDKEKDITINSEYLMNFAKMLR